MLGIGSLAKKVFGTPNDRKIKSTRPLIDQINALEPEFQALDVEGLRAKTAEFKARVEKGESLDHLLPEAFANCREALGSGPRHHGPLPLGIRRAHRDPDCRGCGADQAGVARGRHDREQFGELETAYSQLSGADLHG